jgi:hypothetical protein
MPPHFPLPNGDRMAKQLVKIVNTVNGNEFSSESDLKNLNFVTYCERNPEEFELVYDEVNEEEGDNKPSLKKLMAKSVKELQKIAADSNISFGVPLSHMTKAEIAGAIIESMKGKK